VSEIETPAIYAVLARQPPGMVAEYPMAHAGVTLYRDRLYQGEYGKPTLNGYEENTSGELLAFSLSNLNLPSTIHRLAALGVRYVVLNKLPLPESWAETATPAAGLRPIAQSPAANLYVVDATPQSPAVATMGKGFIAYSITASVSTAALEAPEGEIELLGSCTACRGALKMKVASPERSREMVIADSAGRTLLRRTVSDASRVSLPVRFDRHMTLTVSTRPGPPPENPSVSRETVLLEVAEPEFVASHRLARPEMGGREHAGGRGA
jgi:hypothetical protein